MRGLPSPPDVLFYSGPAFGSSIPFQDNVAALDSMPRNWDTKDYSLGAGLLSGMPDIIGVPIEFSYGILHTNLKSS